MKIKKLLVLILSIITIIMCVCFCGCSSNYEDVTAVCGDRFNIVSVDTKSSGAGTACIVLYDKETKVMYLFYKYGYGGGLTVMLDENGKPLLYEGD